MAENATPISRYMHFFVMGKIAMIPAVVKASQLYFYFCQKIGLKFKVQQTPTESGPPVLLPKKKNSPQSFHVK